MIQQQDFIKTDVKIHGKSDESIQMGIDTESVSHLMMILSTNLYQNSIGSIVREYTSNAIDANIEANSDNPVIVKLTTEDFSVQDFGTGLDDKDFRSIISKYGKSTKRDKNDQLGFFGLGTKSAFSYSKMFHYTCRKDKVERKYLLYKSEIGFQIDLLFEKETEEKNGVTVSIPIKRWDFSTFKTEIKNQLCYFDNVFFDIEGEDLNSKFELFVDNKNGIQRSTLKTDNEMHICLGKVCYPINWKIISLNPINLPIGLKFSLDSGIFPTPNRESIIWNDATKNLVISKIEQVCKNLVEEYNKKVETVDDLYEAYPFLYKKEKYLEFLGLNYDISCLSSYFGLNFSKVKIKNVERDSLFYGNRIEYMLSDYYLAARVQYGILSTKRLYADLHSSTCLSTKVVLLNENDKISGFLADFIKFKKHTFIAKKRNFIDLKKKDTKYYEQLLEKSYTKKQLEEYLKVKEDFEKKYFIDYTNISSDPEYLKYREESKSKRKSIYVSKKLNKQSGEIIVQESYKIPNRYNSFGFKRKTLQVDNISKLPYLNVLIEDSENFDNKFIEIFLRQKIKFIKISKNNYKKIKDLKFKNMIKFKDLEKCRAFSRVATSLKIKKLISSYEKLTDSKIEILEGVLKKLRNQRNELKKYMENNIEYTIKEADMILAAAESHNIWDHSIYHKVLDFEKNISNLDFINYIAKPNYNTSGDPKDYQNLIYSLLLMKKLKFDSIPSLKLIENV